MSRDLIVRLGVVKGPMKVGEKWFTSSNRGDKLLDPPREGARLPSNWSAQTCELYALNQTLK